MTWRLGAFAGTAITGFLVLVAVVAFILLSDWRRPRP